MAQTFKETAHLNINPKVYGDNYDHIFNNKNDNCPDCDREQCWGGGVCLKMKQDKDEQENEE